MIKFNKITKILSVELHSTDNISNFKIRLQTFDKNLYVFQHIDKYYLIDGTSRIYKLDRRINLKKF